MDTNRLTVTIDADTKKLFKMWCINQGITMSDVIEQMASDLSDSGILKTSKKQSMTSKLAYEWYTAMIKQRYSHE